MTYTFMLGEVERCFTVYHPLNLNGALPVMFSPNCYAKDKLSGIEGLNDKSSGNAAAKRYGFARIGLSTPGIRGHPRLVHERILDNSAAQPGLNGQLSCLHSFKIF